jgi:hypothetical protein
MILPTSRIQIFSTPSSRLNFAPVRLQTRKNLIRHEILRTWPRSLQRGAVSYCQSPLPPKLNTDFVVLYHVPSHRIHNAYLLASAWKIVLDTLYELGEDGLSDKTVKMQLKNDESLRSRYLVLYDMVNVLVNTSQAKFSVLATTTRKAQFLWSMLLLFPHTVIVLPYPSTLFPLFQTS